MTAHFSTIQADPITERCNSLRKRIAAREERMSKLGKRSQAYAGLVALNAADNRQVFELMSKAAKNG